MTTAAEAKTYRDDLLEAGVAIELTADESKAVAEAARRSSGPAREVHKVNVEDMLACGLLKAQKRPGALLILPPRKDAFEAAVDLLRYEAMQGPRSVTFSKHARSAAKKIEDRGIELGILDKIEFRSGTVTVRFEGGKSKKFSGSVIGAWGVHKDADGKRWGVTHMTVGGSAARFSQKKKAAELAKILSESPFPWRLLRYTHDTRMVPWLESSSFAREQIDKLLGRQGRREQMATNRPQRQLSLFGF